MTDPGDMRSFGVLLRQTRRAAGLTQEDLADRSGLSVRSIRDLERDRTRRPHPRSVTLLLDALGAAEPARSELRAAARAVPRPDDYADAGPVPVPAVSIHVSTAVTAAVLTPQQLPSAVADFTGRDREI